MSVYGAFLFIITENRVSSQCITDTEGFLCSSQSMNARSGEMFTSLLEELGPRCVIEISTKELIKK